MELVRNKPKKKVNKAPEPDRSEEVEFQATEPDVIHGKAVYHHCGNCFECGTPVYLCMTHPVRHDDLMGNTLAAFVSQATNRAPATYCQSCYRNWSISVSGNYTNPGWRYENNARLEPG